MPRNTHGKPPDLYPEILQRLRQEIAAKAAHEQAASPAIATANTQLEIQSSTASSAPNSNPQQISQLKSKDKKEKPAMPATVTTHAKAALRARKSDAKSSSRRSLGEGGSHRPLASNESESSFERHSRKCTICNHPDREAIEELFINWHSPQSIRGLFAIYHPFDWSAVYRHARAAGLFAKRSKNLRAVLDLLLEGATHVKPTAHGVIAAVRAYSCLTEENKWVEPRKRVHIVNEIYRHEVPVPANTQAAPPSPAPANSAEPAGAVHAQVPARTSFSSSSAANAFDRVGSPLATSHSPLISNRQPTKLESPPTHT